MALQDVKNELDKSVTHINELVFESLTLIANTPEESTAEKLNECINSLETNLHQIQDLL